MNTRLTKHCLSLMISSLLLLPAVNSHAAETTRVSVDSAGIQGNSSSFHSSISADGRFVAFYSKASNLVEDDTNGAHDVFVLDRTSGETSRVSIDSAGLQANSSSFDPTISADGRLVAFYSGASNLVAGDTNGQNDIFVHDRSTGSTTRVSVDSAGLQGDSESSVPAISADGRLVAFKSGASNLVAGDTNGTYDIFVYDRSAGTTTRVSVDSAGLQGNNESYKPALSADGSIVMFTSRATNLVAGDTNQDEDVFVHDRSTGSTTSFSVDSAGLQGNRGSYKPALSADGRFVAFGSLASNLVEGDTNGAPDIFVHDRITGAISLVSVDSAGQPGDNASFTPTISKDGRFVAFKSNASNLVAGDTNGTWDVFVHDRSTGSTTRVSVDSTGQEGNDDSSSESAISADGRFVAFDSTASNLVEGDTNSSGDIFVRDRLLNTNKTADLQLTVTSQPASAQTGQTASYAYTLTNNGPDSISGTAVKLTDVISNGDLIGLTPSQGGCSKAAVSVCNLGSLAAGSSVTLTADIKAGSDPLTQQLSVNAPPVDNVQDNNSVTVSTPVAP